MKISPAPMPANRVEAASQGSAALPLRVNRPDARRLGSSDQNTTTRPNPIVTTAFFSRRLSSMDVRGMPTRMPVRLA